MSLIEIARKAYFSAGVLTDDSKTPHGEGFNFTIEARVTGPMHPVSGLVINLTDLDLVLKEVIGPLDHRHLDHEFPQWLGSGQQDGELKRFTHLSETLFKAIDEKLSAVVGEDSKIHLSGISLSVGDRYTFETVR